MRDRNLWLALYQTLLGDILVFKNAPAVVPGGEVMQEQEKGPVELWTAGSNDHELLEEASILGRALFCSTANILYRPRYERL